MRAMVLCAGYGSRMGDLTRELPKPMLPLHGRPILEWILRHLRDQGFTEIAVNLHYRPALIQDYFGDGSRLKIQLTYSHEPELLGGAGGVKKMETFLRPGDPFLVHYGDVVTDQDLAPMLRFHREKKALATLLLHQRAQSNSVVSLDPSGRIVGFLERPTDDERRGIASSWVNSGVCLCRPDLLDHIPPHQVADLPRDIFPSLVPGGELFGFPLTGRRCAIDSPQRLDQAHRLFPKP